MARGDILAYSPSEMMALPAEPARTCRRADPPRPVRALAWALACLLAAGCTVGPNFQKPAPPAVDRYHAGAR